VGAGGPFVVAVADAGAADEFGGELGGPGGRWGRDWFSWVVGGRLGRRWDAYLQFLRHINKLAYNSIISTLQSNINNAHSKSICHLTATQELDQLSAQLIQRLSSSLPPSLQSTPVKGA